MGHTCSTVLIKCMDFRLTRDVYAWLEEKQLVNDCDMISVAGATKDLVENPQGFFSPDQTGYPAPPGEKSNPDASFGLWCLWGKRCFPQ